MKRSMRIVPAAAALALLAGGCELETTHRESGTVSSGMGDGGVRADGRVAQPGRVLGTSEMSFPTGNDNTSLVRITSVPGAKQVRVGQPYTYEVKVTNLSREITLENVAVHQELPGSVRIAGIRPEGMAEGDRPGTFSVGHLNPGETKSFEVAVVPQEAGRFESCMRVTYNPVLCTTIDVVAPVLSLVREAPERALACEPIPVRYVVTNTGTGTADNIMIRDTLPDGFTGPSGTPEIQINAGSLSAGESKTFPVKITARRSGELASQAMAMTADGLEARAEARPIVVWSPQLEVEITGPDTEYAGKPLEYRAIVHNRGDGPAQHATLNLEVAPGAQLVSSSVPVKGGYTNIPLGDIGPGESSEAVFLFQVPKPGDARFVATASAACAHTPPREIITRLQGVSSLLLEVVDNFDPVKIDGQEVYQIMVVNQGAVQDTNIRIVALVPENFEVVKVEGPTEPKREGDRLVFAPVATLAAGQKVVWNVTVKALRTGDVRFRTEMVSDTLIEPVIETEATRIY
jgi:hypothetical protein